MRKKLFVGLAVAVVSLGSVLPQISFADSGLDDKKAKVDKQIKASNDKINETKKQIKTAGQRIAEAKANLDQAKKKLSDVRTDLAAARVADVEVAKELDQAKKDLVSAQNETELGKKRVAGQEVLIGRAVREAYQQQSDLSGLGILLGAESPRDLASRLQWKETVFSSTAAELERLNVLVTELETAQKKQAEIEKLVSEKKKAAAETVSRVAALESAAESQTHVIAALVVENEKVKREASADLEKEMRHNEQLAAESAAIGAQIKAELEARRRAEEEARKNNQPVPPPVVANPSSGLIRPVGGWISSGYGWRTHPISGRRAFHSGTDFALGCGEPIRASAAGQVKMSSWNGGYGNYVRIDHGRIGGNALTTAYAHLSRYAVRAGQNVQQGDVIGYVGTTGASTGCHLHFEVWVNGSTTNPMSYV